MKKYGRWVLVYLVAAAAVVMTAQRFSRAVTVLSEQAPVLRKHCIVIDAGHGGVDGGATSCAGILESKYNLEIAARLNDLLHLLGYRTKMIRTTDISVYTCGDTIGEKKISDLKQRVQLVNQTENALLLSIHQNFFADSRYKGAQVFYPDQPGSRELAQALQDAFCRTVNPGSSRRSKPSSGIYLMEHIRMPGVLIECGFLSNPEEEALLRTAEYQQKLCCVIASTVSQYLSGA